MNLEGDQTISNTASRDVAESLAAEETVDSREKNSDWTVEDRVRRARAPQQLDSRRPRSAYAVGKCVPPRRTQNFRSPTPGDREPRNFLTGIEHKTKFMRDLAQDASPKSRFNSGATSCQGQRTRAEPRAVNKWRQNKLDCLERQPERKRDARELTPVGSSYLSRAFPNRNQSELDKSAAAVSIRQAVAHNTATNSKISEYSKTPVNKCAGAAKEGSDATKAGKISKLQRINRLASPSKETVKLEASANQGEEMTDDCSSNPTLDQTSYLPEPNASDNLKQATSKGSGLWLNLPKSPTSEQRSSNDSSHTTPRSPRCPPPAGQKTASNPRLQLPIAGTPGNSVTSSETLETQNTSSPQANVSSSTTLRGGPPINKCKLLPRSDNNNTVTNKTRDLSAKSSQNKMTIGKQEPMTFTNHFVPLLRWNNKTFSDDLFGPNSTNSNANPDGGGNALNGKPPEGELSTGQQSKETAGSYGVQSHGADEDNDVLHPSLLFTSGEGGENLANVRRTKKKSPTQDGALSTEADRNQTRNQETPLKSAWKLTGPQQIVSGCTVSGCTLSSPTTSAQLRRPQSVKNIAMAKEAAAAYLRSANRPISAGIKDNTREATGNKRPAWK